MPSGRGGIQLNSSDLCLCWLC